MYKSKGKRAVDTSPSENDDNLPRENVQSGDESDDDQPLKPKKAKLMEKEEAAAVPKDKKTKKKAPAKKKDPAGSADEDKQSEDVDSADETKVEPQKAKPAKKNMKNETDEGPKAKKEKQPKKNDSAGSVGSGVDEDGNSYFNIGRNRRVSLGKFKDMQMINIREYYEEKGSKKMKPGKKGIALNKDEWQKLLELGDQFKFD